jgi:hypothetical protein
VDVAGLPLPGEEVSDERFFVCPRGLRHLDIDDPLLADLREAALTPRGAHLSQALGVKHGCGSAK